MLDGVVVSVEGPRAVVETADGSRLAAARDAAQPGDRVRVLLRPDAAELTAGGAAEVDGLAGVVEEVADPGPIVRGRVRLDGGERVTITRPRRASGLTLRPGARLTLRWPPEEVRLLAPDS